MPRVQERCLHCVCTGMWSQLLLLLREVVLRERWGKWFPEISAQLSATVGNLSGAPVKQHFIFCSVSFCFININQTSLLSSKTASTHSISPYFLLQNQPANTIHPHPQQTKHLRWIFEICFEGGITPFLSGSGALLLSICWSMPGPGLLTIQTWQSDCHKTCP